MDKTLQHSPLSSRLDRSGATSLRGRDVFVRSAVSAALEAVALQGRTLYPGDADTAALTRAATTPGAILSHGGLAQTALADFVLSLAPSSAAASLIASGLPLDDAGYASIRLPGIAAFPVLGFVADGAPIPFTSFPFGSATLDTHKLAGAVAYTRSLARHSNFEDVLRVTLGEAVSLSLDAGLFSTAAGSMTRPAGLLNGVTPQAGALGGDDEAMFADLNYLATAVAPVAGERITFVASPKQAAKIALQGPRPFPYEMRASQALAEGTVAAVATNLVASRIDPTPTFSASEEALVHMVDAPLPIVESGVTADPVRSMWQTDSIVMRVILGVTWARRASGGVAVVTGATW